MTNEEKAIEIKKEFEQYGCECVPNDCYDAALKMAQWKDNCLSNWLDILNKEIDKLTTGNLAHNKTHIKCLLYEIQEQLKGK